MKMTRKDVLLAIITNAVFLLGIHATDEIEDGVEVPSAWRLELYLRSMSLFSCQTR